MTDLSGALMATDPAIAEIIRREVERQNTTIQLIASENFTSFAVLAASGSVLTNKYAEGYPGKRYYGGNAVVDEAENLARERCLDLFAGPGTGGTTEGLHANVQPHAGANANLAAYMAVLEPGDKVMGLRLDQGGHLTHGSPVNATGKLYDFVAYGVDDETEVLDYDAVATLARKERPKAIVCGYTAYPRVIDFPAFRRIADEVGALLIADIAHIAGLVAGGAHPSPVGLADIVTFTTHKTLRGPRGAAIICKEEYAQSVDKAVFPGLQGGPLMHVIAAKAVCFKEAATPEFSDYAHAVVRNARALAAALAGEGFRVVSGGTDNHLMLIDLRPFGITGKVAEDALDAAGITLNKNTIPNDPESPSVTSGLRLGTAAVTTAGMGGDEMAEIASLIGKVVRAPGDESVRADVCHAVTTLCSKFPPYPDL